MDYEPKDIIVLGAIKSGAKKFDKIQKVTKIDPKELNEILERLEERDMIRVEEKKGWLGNSITSTKRSSHESRPSSTRRMASS